MFALGNLSIYYLGLFLTSFLLSLIVFIPIPTALLALTAILDERLDPVMVATLNAVGITAAKTIIFLLAYYGRRIAFSKKIEKKFSHMKRLAERHGWKAILLGSIIPAGGDIIYLTLGVAKYSIWKFITFVLLGKLILSSLLVLATVIFGRPFVTYFVSELSNPVYIFIIILSSVLVIGIMAYLVIRADVHKTKK